MTWHNELGQFESEEEAISAAWEVTPPGSNRPQVLALPVVEVKPPGISHPLDPLFYPESSYIRAAGPSTAAHSIEDSYAGPALSKILTHCGDLYVGHAVKTAERGWPTKCPKCAQKRASVFVPGARVFDSQFAWQGIHIVECSRREKDSSLAWVQFHCNRIGNVADMIRITVPGETNVKCPMCFDPKVECPVAPSRWS